MAGTDTVPAYSPGGGLREPAESSSNEQRDGVVDPADNINKVALTVPHSRKGAAAVDDGQAQGTT